MSDFGTTIDTDNIEDEDGFTPLPKGDYDVIVEKAEVVDIKAGDGKMMKLQLKVEGPTMAGRVIFDQIAISTTNGSEKKQTWVKIGHQKLKGLCGATGVTKPSDSQIFVNKRAKVKVTVTKETEDYDAGNDVKRYSASGAVAPTGGAASSQSDDSKPPWG